MMYQKEISVLTQKYRNAVGFQTSDRYVVIWDGFITYARAAKLENLLRQRDKDIENLMMEKKYFDKTKREQDKAIISLKQERDYFAKVWLLWYQF